MWSHILVPGRDGAERAVCSRTAQSHFRMLVCSWVSSRHTGADAFALRQEQEMRAVLRGILLLAEPSLLLR